MACVLQCEGPPVANIIGRSFSCTSTQTQGRLVYFSLDRLTSSMSSSTVASTFHRNPYTREKTTVLGSKTIMMCYSVRGDCTAALTFLPAGTSWSRTQVGARDQKASRLEFYLERHAFTRWTTCLLRLWPQNAAHIRHTDHDLDHLDPIISVMIYICLLCQSCILQIPPEKYLNHRDPTTYRYTFYFSVMMYV